ncbi:MAG: hypothetical protein SF162_03955 [bacterium]|nr:hypothetical protein [bacterium]
MSVAEIIEQVRALSPAARDELMAALELLTISSTVRGPNSQTGVEIAAVLGCVAETKVRLKQPS